MADASQQPSDRRLAVEAQRGEGASRFPFLLTDDLRSPLDDLQRLRDAEVKTREIIQKYQAAMREMMVRFEILDQDLNLKKHRNPIHHLESRIKKPASIFEKLERYGKEPTLENLERYIMDVAGVRVICSYIHDVYNLLELLQKQDDLEIVEIKITSTIRSRTAIVACTLSYAFPCTFLTRRNSFPSRCSCAPSPWTSGPAWNTI